MQIRRDFLRSLEAAIVGVFWVQTIRFLYAALYADVSSAELVQRVADVSRISHLPGYVDPADVRIEIYAAAATLLAPLLALIIARTRWSIPLAVAAAVVARSMILEFPDSSALAAAVVVASGLLYMTLLAIRRPRFLPVMIATAFAGDQIIRALNATADPTFDPNYSFFIGSFEINIGVAISAIAVFALILTGITTLVEREESRLPGYHRQPVGVLTGWGALALGAILFLEFSLLALPNAVARLAHMDYYLMVPMILMATTLPLVPEVRAQAGNFLSIFDGNYRGWLWALLLALFVIIGRRYEGFPAGLTLSLAQFLAILTLWWLVRQPEERPRVNPTPILVLFGSVIFILLSIGDYFTYDYAYVRPIAAPFSFVSDLLSGMEDMGLPLILVAVVLACMPMILERQIIPWREGKVIETLMTLSLVVIVTVSATRAAVPAPIIRPLDADCLRAMTFNIHSGYTQFFAPNLEMVADTLERSGASIILLQEVETGRLSSGSVDQAIWLANRLNMNATYFPENEALQGLAVLSRLDVDSATGAELTSLNGNQAAVQYVKYSLDQSGDLHVYNVWLGFRLEDATGQPLPDSQQDQNQQFEELNRLIASNHFGTTATGSAPDRVLIGGTFNFDESDALYQRWTETILQDPFTGIYDERRDTLYLVDGRSSRYDYLWLLNLTPSGTNIDINNLASDHRPALVAFGRDANTTCPS